MNRCKYDIDPVVFKNNIQTKFVLNAIGNNKDVCEFGCSSGMLSQLLKEKGCAVTGLDIDSLSLTYAKGFQKETINVNLNDIEKWVPLLGVNKYDALLFLHILEHLVEPEKVLSKALEFLKQDGIVIIAIPNINNARDRFNIFFGEFNYTEFGVMDKTHVRFFNFKTINKLIKDNDLIVEEYITPWQVNPVREFVDHIPILSRIKRLFPKKPTLLFRKNKNLTDVVMVFKCKKNA
ncbi:TPA: class I SAM-dependent methyltransferase [bacterium]|nr:class I SAM-dependent methyltransferase [bacterium]